MSIPAEKPEQRVDPTVSVLVGGRYRLLQRIGSGGMGVVWLAHDEVLRRRVAVKELHHGWGNSDRTVAEGRERTLREARAAAALHHPNIVSVYDIVDHDGRPWIVMELVTGRSLKEMVVEDGPVPVDRAVDIGLQLLSALQAAHGAGITHRDVKPANVLVCDGDRVRLTDFGLATMPDADSLTQTGAVLGTPGYLAPEQAKGLAPGPPADVFGLGATLYYAIEGVGPFQRDGYLPMLAAYARHDIRPPQRAATLAPALLRLLIADPGKRPTAEQARDMLLGGAIQPSRLPRRLLLTGGAAATVAAAGVGLWFRRWNASTAGQAPTVLPSVSQPYRASMSQTPLPAGLGDPAWQRDDLQSPVVVGSGLVGLRSDGLHAVDLMTGKQRWRKGPQGTYTVTELGKDLLLRDDERGTSQVLDGATGRVRWTLRQGTVLAGAADFLVVRESASTLNAYDANSGRKRWRVRIVDGFRDIHFGSPSGVLCGVVDTGRGRYWMYGIRRTTGSVSWRTRLPAADVCYGPWGHDDQVYVAMGNRGKWTVVTLDARTGTLGSVLPMAEFDPDRTDHEIRVFGLVFVGSTAIATVYDTRLTLDQAGLTAINGGAVRWHRPLLNPKTAVSNAGRLFAASYDSILQELDPATGKTLWSVSTPGPVNHISVGSAMLMVTIGSRTTAYRLPRR